MVRSAATPRVSNHRSGSTAAQGSHLAYSRPADAGVVRIAGLVAHPIRKLGQHSVEFLPGMAVGDCLLKRAAHAEQPGIALGIADRKSHMPLPQSWMAFLGRIEFWAARPFGQVALEHV